jgi:hypothetical protein
MSEACLEKTTHSDSQRHREPLRQSPYIATTTEAIKNYKENWAGVWFKETVDASDPAGNFAFQRLRHTWFTPKIDPESDSGAMTNFTLSVHVLCAALKTS